MSRETLPGWWDDGFGAVGVVPVEADEAVVVHDAPDLEFVNLEVAAAEFHAEDAAEAAEFAVDLLDGAPP
jgi:hypothetical protein